jgi:hypothetical protein
MLQLLVKITEHTTLRVARETESSNHNKLTREIQILNQKSTVFCAVKPHTARRFGGTYSLHFNGRKTSQARDQQKLFPKYTALEPI